MLLIAMLMHMKKASDRSVEFESTVKTNSQNSQIANILMTKVILMKIQFFFFSSSFL